MKKRYKLPKGFSLVNADQNIFNKQKQDSAWYTYGTTQVVRVQYKENFYDVLCCGEMRIEYNGNTIRYTDELLSAGITTDKKLFKLTEADEIEWINNSWFEVYKEDQDCDWYEPNHSVEEAIMYAVEILLAEEKEIVNV